MNDLLLRVLRAVPSVEAWMQELLATHSPSASKIDTQKFARLANYLPPHVLEAGRVIVAQRTPFPPVSSYGVPEFAEMEAAEMAGITFGDTYFLSSAHAADEGTHFHELIHTIQWRALGIRDFLLTYGLGLATFGYEQSPLEAIAYALQGAFERGHPVVGLERLVSLHATQARLEAQAVFAASDVPWSA